MFMLSFVNTVSCLDAWGGHGAWKSQKSIQHTRAALSCPSLNLQSCCWLSGHFPGVKMESSAEASFENALHRSIKRSIVAWKLVMNYKDHDLEAPPAVLQLAVDTAVSKRTWERCICKARQELAQALALSAKAKDGADAHSSKNESQWVSGLGHASKYGHLLVTSY